MSQIVTAEKSLKAIVSGDTEEKDKELEDKCGIRDIQMNEKRIN